MNHYLLVLIENSGGYEHVTRHVIEAQDRQMVKFHYHRTLKDWGYVDTQHNKHTLKNGDGLWSEIQEIRSLDPTEYDILSKHIGKWAKV